VRLTRTAGDTGEADPAVNAVLLAYAAGEATEHALLTAVAASRLLVPVVAVLAEANADGTEKQTEMALPTLVGNDGRTAAIAFTSTDTLRKWRADARPVPVPAPRLWAAARTEADAVVVDVAGPVPFVVEGARLRALANGESPPPAHEDADIQAVVAEVIGGSFILEPGGPAADLVIIVGTADMATARAVADELGRRLGPRLRRGIEIRAAGS
jgi:SseB protein N-terminal domain